MGQWTPFAKKVCAVGLGLICYVWLDPDCPTHCCINHHQGWEKGNKNLCLGLNPAITQHTGRDVLLHSFHYSHHSSLTALNSDRFLSFYEWRAISLVPLTYCSESKVFDDSSHSSSPKQNKLKIKNFCCKIPSTPYCCDHFQMENLQRNAAFNCTLPAAHTGDWPDRNAIIRTVSTGHKGKKM